MFTQDLREELLLEEARIVREVEEAIARDPKGFLERLQEQRRQ